MVDALGGVRIHVKERIVDAVTRPAWGETKPTIDVDPGRTYLFTGPDGARLRPLAEGVERLRADGAAALLPERRSRARSTRESVLRHFGALTAIARDTRSHGRSAAERARPRPARRGGRPRADGDGDIRHRLHPRRRADDGYPLPAIGLMRAAARDAIVLDPGELERRRGIATRGAVVLAENSVRT